MKETRKKLTVLIHLWGLGFGRLLENEGMGHSDWLGVFGFMV